MPFANYLKRTKNPENFKKGIDMIVHFRDTIPQQYRQMLEAYFNGMILNSIASAKQSKGLTEQADYVRSKLPVKPKAPEAASVPVESLQKYTGEYEFNGSTAKVSLKDDKTLLLVTPNQPEMELVPVSKGKFNIKLMEGFSVEFTSNDKGDITELILKSPGQQIKAAKKK
jgi:hypothetical protein